MLAATLGALLLVAAPARAQPSERIVDYGVDITIGDDGTLTIVETIDYDFGTVRRHGILRDIPTRLRYDDTYDRIYPLDVVEVRASEGTPAGYEVESAAGGITRIRVGDADTEITGRHTYELTYTVEAALNGFLTMTSCTGTRWVPSGRRRSSGRPCRARARRHHAGGLLPRVRGLDPSLPALERRRRRGAVRPDRAGLVQRSDDRRRPAQRCRPRARARARGTLEPRTRVCGDPGDPRGHGRARPRRDRRRDRARLGPRTRPPVPGSQVDQVMGNPTGEHQAVPLGEADESAPVEFAPPDDMRPGQMGTSWTSRRTCSTSRQPRGPRRSRLPADPGDPQGAGSANPTGA